MDYRQVRELLLMGQSVEEIGIATGIPIPELLSTIPLIYDQINAEYTEKAPNAAAINFARLESMINAIMTKIGEAGPRDLVSLGNSLVKLTEAQNILKNEIKERKPLVSMPEQRNEEKPKIVTNEEKKRTFLDKYKDQFGALSPGERGLLTGLEDHDPE